MWEYKTSVSWKGGEAAVLQSDHKPNLDITPPPEFGGQPDRWSPEDLIVGAVESCMLLTLLFFVEKMKINMTRYESEATGTLDRTNSGLRFQEMSVHISADVETAADEEKFKKAARQAEKFCPVSAAVSCPIVLTADARVDHPA